jgi:hypothetical protein
MQLREDIFPLYVLGASCGESFLPAERLRRMITCMLRRKEVKVALLFPTIAVDNMDRFRGGDHNYHHRTSADYHKHL